MIYLQIIHPGKIRCTTNRGDFGPVETGKLNRKMADPARSAVDQNLLTLPDPGDNA